MEQNDQEVSRGDKVKSRIQMVLDVLLIVGIVIFIFMYEVYEKPLYKECGDKLYQRFKEEIGYGNQGNFIEENIGNISFKIYQDDQTENRTER